MNIFQAQFATGQVVDATGVAHAALQTWLRRGLVVGQKDSPIVGGGSPGRHRRFSFFNVMEIAIAKALQESGLGDLENAFNAARHFAHVGRGEISEAYPARVPSCPYDNAGKAATTLIAVRGDRSTEVFWTVGADPIPNIWLELGGRGFVVIDAGEVFERTVTALGYDPVQVMTLAYGETRH